MSKSRNRTSRPKTRWLLVVILVVATILTYIGFKYFGSSVLQPQSAGIFVLDQPVTTYGPITATGSIRKELLEGGKANYILITNTGSAIQLNVTGVDQLVGFNVVVKGIRLPLDPESGMRDVLKVSTITLEATQ